MIPRKRRGEAKRKSVLRRRGPDGSAPSPLPRDTIPSRGGAVPSRGETPPRFSVPSPRGGTLERNLRAWYGRHRLGRAAQGFHPGHVSRRRTDMFGRRIPLFKVSGFPINLDTSWFLVALLVTWSLATGLFP